MDVKSNLAAGKPADFSFQKMHKIDPNLFKKAIGLEAARFTRTGSVPERGVNRKYLTKSVWLNNNKLKSITNADKLIEELLEYPEKLGWLDFSFNFITTIDPCILTFKELKILYLHGNCISDIDEIYKLKALPNLRSATFHGNPVSNLPNYRQYVVSVLPQLQNLDFAPIVKVEKNAPIPMELVRKIREENLKLKQESK